MALRLALLLVAVAGAIFRPARIPAFVAPVICAALAIGTGLLSLHGASAALSPLAGPLGFLLAAIPLAVGLDRLGYFEQLARLFGAGRLLVPGLWLLGAGTVAVLNLDAGVVLLTPLYVRIARRHGYSERYLGFQPVLLALLASSFLTVSNLTNLIASSRFSFGPLAVLEHLGLPGATACAVGYLLYKKAAPAERSAASGGRTGDGAEVAFDRRVLWTGSVVVGLVLVGFVAGPSAGIEPWEVALSADVVVVALTKRLPFRSVPLDTALVAASLGLLAATAADHLGLRGLLSGSGPLAFAREYAVSALGANVVNNLPALLVALGFVGQHNHATCALWPVLLGVNVGPSLLVTGSLASLLWIDSMNRLGAPVRASSFLKMGARVALPAGLVALAVLVALSPAVGCG